MLPSTATEGQDAETALLAFALRTLALPQQATRGHIAPHAQALLSSDTSPPVSPFLQLPNIATEGQDAETAALAYAFAREYQDHVHRVLSLVYEVNFMEVEALLFEFWATRPQSQVNILGEKFVLDYIALCDDILTEVSVQPRSAKRSFAHNSAIELFGFRV